MSARAEARDPTGRSGPLRLLFFAIGGAGLLVTLLTGYLLVRSAFLGGPRLAPVPLLLASGACFFGIIVFAFGSAKALDVGVRQ